jgi:hypothetical protein
MIIHRGQNHVITMDALKALGTVDFTTNEMREMMRDRNFTGVPISAILQSLNINTATVGNLQLYSPDNVREDMGLFQTTYTAANAMSIGYIVIAEDGEPLGEGPRGPVGPFYAVLRGMANNNWARHVKLIVVN